MGSLICRWLTAAILAQGRDSHKGPVPARPHRGGADSRDVVSLIFDHWFTRLDCQTPVCREGCRTNSINCCRFGERSRTADRGSPARLCGQVLVPKVAQPMPHPVGDVARPFDAAEMIQGRMPNRGWACLRLPATAAAASRLGCCRCSWVLPELLSRWIEDHGCSSAGVQTVTANSLNCYV